MLTAAALHLDELRAHVILNNGSISDDKIDE